MKNVIIKDKISLRDRALILEFASKTYEPRYHAALLGKLNFQLENSWVVWDTYEQQYRVYKRGHD